MGETVIEKIIHHNTGKKVKPGDIATVSPEGLSMSRSIRILYRPDDNLSAIIQTIRTRDDRNPPRAPARTDNPPQKRRTHCL